MTFPRRIVTFCESVYAQGLTLSVMDWMRILGTVALVVLAIAFAAALAGGPDRHADRIDMNATMREAAELRIALAGFLCPRAKLAYRQGLKPQGETVRIVCGPDDGTAATATALTYDLIVDGPHTGHVTVTAP